MVELENYERGNTIKASVTFKSNGTPTDPSGNTAFVKVIKSDATYLVGSSASGAEASRVGTGQFDYYFTPSATDPLGLWVVHWYAQHDLGTIDSISYGYKDIVQRNAFRLVDTEQE